MTQTSDTRSDQELIAAINGGDSEAFEALYYRYRDWVVSLSFRFTQDHATAIDVLQETFLYLLKKFPGFELRCQMKTFLYPPVKNLSLAALRKTRQWSSDPEHLDQLEAPDSMETSSASARAGLARTLTKLSEAQRETILLRFVDDLSLNEIAQALELPVGTVKSRLHTALETLRNDPEVRSFFLE